MKTLRLIILIIALLCMEGLMRMEASEKISKPNVVFIYADDLGRGMLSYYGQNIVSTPNIDRLANKGVVFNNVRGCMFCAPARASLLTGYHDCHPDKWDINQGGAYLAVSEGIKPEHISTKIDEQRGTKGEEIQHLAQVFKEAGYVTGQFGKLEWGFSVSLKEMENHGWDHYCGYLDHIRAHGFYPPFLFEDGKKLIVEGNTRKDCGKIKEKYNGNDTLRHDMTGKSVYVQNLLLDKILSFINEHQDSSFFVYHPTTLPHGPVAIPEVHPDFVNNTELTQIEKEYASMVKMLDDHVGVIIQELEKLNLMQNTMIIFSSDNGHELYYSLNGRCTKKPFNIHTNQPYNNVSTKYYSELGFDVFDGNDGMAGRKRDNWEGGLRVPLFFYWPHHFPSGKQLNNLVANYDIITTMADVVNVKVKDRKDGISLLPILKGEDTTIEHKYVVNASFMGASLVTNEGWKLRHYAPKDIFQLYYLPDDYREESDLADQYPNKVALLKDLLIRECHGDLNNGFFRKETGMLPPVKYEF
ncbi:sulfatase [Labilibacter sediminis]|nr:sulfatase [Labilibacter sediminis]